MMRIVTHTVLLGVLMFLLVPIVFFQSQFILTNLITDLPILVIINLMLLVYFIENEISRYKYQSVFLLTVAVIAVFASFLRMIPLPMGMTLSFLIPIVAGCVYGQGFGLIIGQLSMLIGGVFLGALGPWTPYQSFLMGIIGFYAGFFFHGCKSKKIFWFGIVPYVVLVSFAYGYWMSVTYWSVAVQNLHVPRSWSGRFEMYNQFYASTSLIWDFTRMVGNMILFGMLYRVSRGLLERANQRLIYYKS